MIGQLDGGGVWANVLHFLADDNPGALSDLLDAVAAFYSSQLDQDHTSKVTIKRFVAKVLNSGTVVERQASLTGGLSGKSLPYDIAAVISLRTALASRSGRGRIFLPPPGEARYESVEGAPPQFIQGFCNAVALRVKNFLLSTSPGDHALVVRSQSGGGVNVVTSGYVDGRPDSQRGREAGGTFRRVTF